MVRETNRDGNSNREEFARAIELAKTGSFSALDDLFERYIENGSNFGFRRDALRVV